MALRNLLASALRLLHNLANTYARQGQRPKAAQLYRGAAEARERELGPRHPLTLDDMYMVGSMAAMSRDRSEALHWLGRAVELGYRDHANSPTMAEEESLKSLRGDPEFEALVIRARRVEDRPK